MGGHVSGQGVVMVMGMPWSCCWAWGDHADGHAMRMLMDAWWAWACDGHAHGPPTCLTPHRLPLPWGLSMGPADGAPQWGLSAGRGHGAVPRRPPPLALPGFPQWDPARQALPPSPPRLPSSPRGPSVGPPPPSMAWPRVGPSVGPAPSGGGGSNMGGGGGGGGLGGLRGRMGRRHRHPRPRDCGGW